MWNYLCTTLVVAMTGAERVPVLPHTSATVVYVMIVFMTARAGVSMQQHALTPGNVQPLCTSDAVQA